MTMDFDKYKFISECNRAGWNMDRRHVEVIHEFVMRNEFNKILEIGCYSGYSTSALVEAINQGKKFELHLSEPSPPESGLLERVIDMCSGQVVLHRKPSIDVLERYGGDFDCIIVDGDHKIEGGGYDLLMILRNQTPIVFAHDTNPIHLKNRKTFTRRSCMGAELLGRALKSHRDYFHIEDNKKRQGERTERGLFFASTDESKYRIALDIFNEVCP